MKKIDKGTLVEFSAEELEMVVGGHKNHGWKATPKAPPKSGPKPNHPRPGHRPG